MDELYSRDVLPLPLDVAERVENMLSCKNNEEWVIFRSRYEARLWLIKRIFEDEEETMFSVIACPIAYMSDHVRTT